MQTESDKFLIRDTLKDEGQVPSPDYAATYSPDIICYQNNILTYREAASSYNKYICRHFLQNTINNIYIRAKNKTGIQQNGQVKAFYSSLTFLYLPGQWKQLQTPSEKTVVDLKVPNKEKADIDDITLCSEAFQLYKVEDAAKHYCIMGLSKADDSSEWLTLPEKFSGDHELWQFLREHPEIAYNNIVIERVFKYQYSETALLGNLNNYSESYVLCFELDADSSFAKQNIGQIQILCTFLECPFDIRITPDKDASTVTSESFLLPAKFEGTVIITYFADNLEQPVHGKIEHKYYTFNSSNKIPVANNENRIIRAVKYGSNKKQLFNKDAQLGSFVILFTSETGNINDFNIK